MLLSSKAYWLMLSLQGNVDVLLPGCTEFTGHGEAAHTGTTRVTGHILETIGGSKYVS